MTPTKLKVYELAKELGQDAQHLIDVLQRLGIDVKNTMSVLGTEEVRTAREYYRKNKTLVRSAPGPVPSTKGSVQEKRVGATVIRRRAAPAKTAAPEEPEAPAPVEEVAPPEEVAVTELPEVTPEIVGAPEETVAPEATEPTKSVETIEEAPEVPAAAASAPEVPVAPPVEKAPVPEAPPKKPSIFDKKPRKIFPSIIKKVTTEQYLGEVVGPKLERKERPKPAPTAARPLVKTDGTPAVGVAGEPGIKRFKEVDLAATEAAKEAARKKVAQRQDGVFRSTDYLKRELIHATKKKKTVINRPAMKTQITRAADHKRVVTMGETISVSEMAKQLGVKANALIGKLMNLGVTATINQEIDHDTAVLAANEFQFEVKQEVFREAELLPTLDADKTMWMSRAPVVTIMGHVDHGKTSLLDTIRKAQVAAGEAGGITQHIGAYTVKTPKGKITFVDTPGHEAFTAMRARGAKVTDIVILVVSAVDGVMPQTLESVAHAKAAQVPIIVAVNKIDLPDANPDRIKQSLAGHELSPEEWGGDTIYVSVSAKTGKNIDQLLEAILLQAEMMELKAEPDGPARGVVLESRLDKNRGPISTLLIQHGKLSVGDLVVCGMNFGKARALSSSSGEKIKEAGPSDPVEILGLPAVSVVGDEFTVVPDERVAREVTTGRSDKQKVGAMASRAKLSLQDMLAQGGSDKEFRVVLKSDVQGSAEALREALLKFPSDKVKLKILLASTGGVTESDIMLAAASGGTVLGFNVRPDVKALKLAEAEGIDVRTFTIIYDLLDYVKKGLEGMLDKEVRQKVIGRAEVREVFSVPKIGTIAGSAVIDGKVIRGCYLRLLRDSRVIYEGKLSSLRRFKDDVKEVSQGFECGIGLENFNDLKLGDQFEAYVLEETATSL